jgi:hypothetical protein
LYTLEEFDQEAARQEDASLRHILNLRPMAKIDSTKGDQDVEDADNSNEQLVLDREDWRSMLPYRQEWEEFSVPPSAAHFHLNSKPPSQMPTAHTASSQHTDDEHEDWRDNSSDSGVGARRYKAITGIELRTHGTNAYAALQSKGLDGSEERQSNASSDTEEADIPTQSIENDVESSQYEAKMDWT